MNNYVLEFSTGLSKKRTMKNIFGYESCKSCLGDGRGHYKDGSLLKLLPEALSNLLKIKVDH